MLAGVFTVAEAAPKILSGNGSYQLVTIKIGETFDSGYGSGITWLSEKPSVAKANSKGIIKGLSAGTTFVGIDYGNNSLYPLFKVTVKKSNVKLNKTKLSVTVGKKAFIYLKDTFSTVKWKTSNKKKATVSYGKITAKAAGKVTISAVYKKKTYKCAVTVKKGTVKLNKKKLTLTKGDSYQLSLNNAGGKVKWKSSNKKIKVNSGGVVTAYKKGKATITAKLGKKSYKCKVISKSPKTISTKFKKSFSLRKGRKLKLKLKGKYKWKSSNKKIAIVKKGTVTAKKSGTVKITAKKGKKKKTCKIRVFADKSASTKKLTQKKNTASFKNGVKVSVDPSLLKSGARLSVSKVSGLPKLNGVKMKTYDFSLSGAKVSSSRVATITIPQKIKKKQIPVAAYYNEKKSRWEPTMCSYKKGKITMVVDHFSPHAVGTVDLSNSIEIMNPKKTTAWILAYWAPPEATISGERALQIVSQAANANKPTKSCLKIGGEALNWLYDQVDWVFDKSTNFYANLTGALIPAHLQDSFSYYANNFGDHIGWLGFALALGKAIRYTYEGKYIEAGAQLFSGVHGLATAYMAKWFGTANLSAGLFASACIGFAINKVYEASLEENEKRWYRVYNSYYELGADGYRHMYQWRNALTKYFKDKSLTPEQLNEKISGEVDAYARAAWNSPWFPAYFYNATHSAFSYNGGLNNEIKEKYVTQKKHEVYTKVIPVVFEWFAKQQANENQESAQKALKWIADLFSKDLDVKFYDGSRKSGKKSQLKGWTVRWKKIPKIIKDKKKLKIKLDKYGAGKTSYTLFASVKYKIGNKIQIRNKKGKVIDTITISKQKIPTTSVNVMTKKVQKYLKAHTIRLNKTKLTLNKGKTYQLKLLNAKKSKVKWTSSNKKIATIKNGIVKGLKKGKAVITAKYHKKTYKCKVTVKVTFHGWKLVSTTDKNDNYKNYTSSDTDFYDTTPPNPEPNTIYALGSYKWTRVLNATGSKGSFSVNHKLTTDDAWSKKHSGACSEYLKAVCAADTPKSKYKNGSHLKLKMKIVGSHSKHNCTGECSGFGFYAKTSYLNPKSSDGFPKHYNYSDGVSYGFNDKTGTKSATTDLYMTGTGAKKGDTLWLSIGVEARNGTCICYTLYKYKYV